MQNEEVYVLLVQYDQQLFDNARLLAHGER